MSNKLLQCCAVIAFAVVTVPLVAEEPEKNATQPPERVSDDITPNVGAVTTGRELIGQTLRDADGEGVGKVSDIILDPYTATAVSLVIEPSDAVPRDRRLLVPVAVVTPIDRDNFTADVPGKVITGQATSLLAGDEATPFTRRMSVATFRNFELKPVWDDRKVEESQLDLDDQFQFLTKLAATDVTDEGGQPLGRIADIVFSRSNGKIVYTLFSHEHADRNDGGSSKKRTFTFPIPLAAFVVSPQTNVWSVELPEQLVDNTRAIQPDELPKEVSRAWVEYIHVRYGGGVFDGVQRQRKKK